LKKNNTNKNKEVHLYKGGRVFSKL